VERGNPPQKAQHDLRLWPVLDGKGMACIDFHWDCLHHPSTCFGSTDPTRLPKKARHNHVHQPYLAGRSKADRALHYLTATVFV